MEDNKEIFFNELSILFKANKVTSSLVYKISNIEENFGEYCLSLTNDDFQINGIFSKSDEKLVKNQEIYCNFYVDKTNQEIKIYAKLTFIENENLLNDIKYSKIEHIYNFKPELIRDTLNEMKFFELSINEENVLMCSNKVKEKIKLFDPVLYRYYYIDKKFIKNTKKNEFIYLKFHMIKDSHIYCNDLTFIQKANDFQIFSSLDKKISNEYLKDFYRVKEIEDNGKKHLAFIFAKVILKDKIKNDILILDKFNRIIRLKYNEFKDLELFDLLFIIDCKIKKDNNNKFYYVLESKKEQLIMYKTKNLIFNKNISINNYSLLNINIPDFQKDNNYYNKIIIANFEDNIESNQQIYIFKFKNELFNEIVPFSIRIKSESDEKEFKFFIVHNLAFNVNIFLNNINGDKNSVDYCYYNYLDNAPYSHEIKINNKEYTISHYNSFDNQNIIGFILVNIPSDESTDKIKNYTKKEIISSQVWLTQSNEDGKISYEPIEILDIDEAKPKNYYKYNLKLEKYSKFKNVYFNMSYFYKKQKWSESKDKAFEYFESILPEYQNTNLDEFKFIKKSYNIDFIPESADFQTFKIYVNLLLLDSMEAIYIEYQREKDKLFSSWGCYLDNMITLVDKLNDLGNSLTFHQKIRITDSYNFNIFKYDNYNFLSRFFYIDEKLLLPDNSYLMAFKFNIDIIKNLTERSALTKGFKQLDSYILKNYNIKDDKTRNEKNYSLINEPLSLMKYHLLINYENFIIIDYTNVYNDDKKVKALQDNSNRVTYINEKILFNTYKTEILTGEDNALPITMEFFHENSHLKRSNKNIDEKAPSTCYKDKVNYIEILDEKEDGKYIESIIGDKNLIINLKRCQNKLGKLMRVIYFTSENFERLKNKYNEIIKSKTKNISGNKIIESDCLDGSKKKKINIKDEELKTLKDFEDYYLENNEFIYPDSIPYQGHRLGDTCKMSQAEKEYREKYKDQIQMKEEVLEVNGFKRKINY